MLDECSIRLNELFNNAKTKCSYIQLFTLTLMKYRGNEASPCNFKCVTVDACGLNDLVDDEPFNYMSPKNKSHYCVGCRVPGCSITWFGRCFRFLGSCGKACKVNM